MITVNITDSNKLNGDKSLFVSFPYDTKVISIIKELPIKYWHSDTKEWEIPVHRLDYLTNALKDYKFKVLGNNSTQLNEIEIFKFKTEPFQHQREGFHFGMQHDKWLLADEPGLGKTKSVIDIAVAKKLQRGYKHCLIICGINGLKWNWQNEIKIHSNETGWILGQRTKNNKTIIGSNTDKLNDILNIDKINSYFLITNVESLRDDHIQYELAHLCRDKTIGFVAIDEIHVCKNASSKQGKGILKLQPECRIAMTGTPLMNNPLDLFIILKWLGYEKHPFYTFKQHYCVLGGFGGYQVVGYRNLDEVQEALNQLMLRRLKSDVLDLPDKLYIDEYVEMSSKQAKIYKEVTDYVKSNIDKISTSINPLAELIRMRQATGYTGILSSTVQESAKLDRMEELVNECVSNNKKVVIFSNWTQITDIAYARLCKKHNGEIITGATKDNERQNIVKEFQTNPNCKFIVGTIGAMGTGITLTEGTVEIFLDEPWTRASKAQAEDRCHRIGSNENITIYTIMCKNTIDERIHQIIERKGMMSDVVIDGKTTKDKVDLINFLLN